MATTAEQAIVCSARVLRKGRGSAFNPTSDMKGEARMIERAFGLAPCGLSEAMSMLENRPAT